MCTDHDNHEYYTVFHKLKPEYNMIETVGTDFYLNSIFIVNSTLRIQLPLQLCTSLTGNSTP